MTGGDGILNQVLLLGIALTRTAAAFTLTPVFSSQTIPPVVSNSIYVAFGLIVLILQPQAGVLHPDALGWISLFFRELCIGLLIGFFYGAVLWSFEAVGQILDAKIGPAMAQLTDPFTGETTSLNGALLGRIGVFVFMLSGGLMLVVQVLLNSYVIWPIAASAPHLRLGDATLVIGGFGHLMALAIGFATPALVVLTVVEGGLGLISRFTPQFNVFSSSLSIKSWLATFIVLATVGLMVDTVVNQTLSRSDFVLNLLRTLSARS